MFKKNIFIFITIVFVSYLIFDFTYEKELQVLNEKLVVYVQKTYGSPFLDKFFNTYTLLVELEGIVFVCLLSLVICKNKLEIQLVFLLLSVHGYTNGLIKMFYLKARPYQDFEEIEAKQCTQDYGKPSGHSQLGMFVYYMLPLAINPKIYKIFGDNKSKFQINFGKILFLIGVTIFIVMIGFAKFYLGDHSFSQVFLGFSIAQYTIWVLYCGAWEKMRAFFLNCLLTPDKTEEQKKQIKQYQKTVFLVYVFLSLAGIFTYLYISLNKKDLHAEHWVANIVEKCGNLNESKLLHRSMLHQTGFVSMPLAIFFYKTSVGNTTYDPELFAREYNKLSVFIKVLRVLVFMIVPSIPIVLIKLIPLGPDMVLSRYFIKSQLLGVCFVLAQAFTGKYLSKWIKLAVPGDLMYNFSSDNSLTQDKKESFSPQKRQKVE